MQGGKFGIDLGEFPVVLGERVEVAAQFAQGLFEVCMGGVCQVDGCAQVRVGIVGTVEQGGQPGCARDQFLIEFVRCAANGLDELPGTGQTLVRRGEFLEPADGVTERHQFVDLIADKALVFPGAGDLGAGFLELSLRCGPRSETLRRGRCELGIDPELVEQPPLNIAGEQLAVFILAVYIDQWTRDRPQCREGGGYSVDEGPGPGFAGVATNEASGLVFR